MEEILAKIDEIRNKLADYSRSNVEKFFLENDLDKLYKDLGKKYYEELRNIQY